MAWTINQKRLVDRLVEALPALRENVRASCVSIKSTLDNGDVNPQFAVKQGQSVAATTANVLARIVARRAELETAIVAVGGLLTDFTDRFNALNDAANALQSATVANIAARLDAIIAALPQETQP